MLSCEVKLSCLVACQLLQPESGVAGVLSDRIQAHLQHIAHKPYGHHADAAAHSTQVVALNVTAELEFVDEHRAE